ncbi:MAG: hypothetical protein ABL860_00035 [Candidatus Nitrotoga sp.]
MSKVTHATAQTNTATIIVARKVGAALGGMSSGLIARQIKIMLVMAGVTMIAMV